MEDGQLPPVQTESLAQPSQNGMPMIQQVQVMPEQKKDPSSLIKTIVIIVLSLISATFIGLFVWMFMQYNEASSDVDAQIAEAVAIEKQKQREEDEADFLEREKKPNRDFSGPADYGELSFQYPKTWSVYVAKDAANGGDFEAYFNPLQVDPISNTTINSLRVQILDKSFEDVTKDYLKHLESKEKPLSVESMTVNGTSANLYSGVIPGTEFNGYILIFKIRDKTAVLRTDSVLFKDDFDALVQTIEFNA